jgi:hypothetical protein
MAPSKSMIRSLASTCASQDVSAAIDYSSSAWRSRSLPRGCSALTFTFVRRALDQGKAEVFSAVTRLSRAVRQLSSRPSGGSPAPRCRARWLR